MGKFATLLRSWRCTACCSSLHHVPALNKTIISWFSIFFQNVFVSFFLFYLFLDIWWMTKVTTVMNTGFMRLPRGENGGLCHLKLRLQQNKRCNYLIWVHWIALLGGKKADPKTWFDLIIVLLRLKLANTFLMGRLHLAQMRLFMKSQVVNCLKLQQHRTGKHRSSLQLRLTVWGIF